MTDHRPLSIRRRTPIFDSLVKRYEEAPATERQTPEEAAAAWALRAYMRGFTYGLVLQEVLGPPRSTPSGRLRFPSVSDTLAAAEASAERKARQRRAFAEPWHYTPSPWDAIDATPTEHDPNL